MSDTAKHVDALRGIPAFDSLSDDDLSRVVSGARSRNYQRRQLIFGSGDHGDSLVVVTSGRVKVSVRSADGGELVLTWVGAGETLGELSLLDGGRRSADVEVMEDVAVVFLERAAVVAMMHENAGFAETIWSGVAASMRRLTEVAGDLVFLDVPRRIAKWLVEQRAATGSLDVTVSQEEIGAHVGATRQSVNLALRGFERRGWVTLGNRRVRLADEAALIRLAGE
jgi:CRP/FNR family cyclic AMP-dependent transcriptional regulator